MSYSSGRGAGAQGGQAKGGKKFPVEASRVQESPREATDYVVDHLVLSAIGGRCPVRRVEASEVGGRSERVSSSQTLRIDLDLIT